MVSSLFDIRNLAGYFQKYEIYLASYSTNRTANWVATKACFEDIPTN